MMYLILYKKKKKKKSFIRSKIFIIFDNKQRRLYLGSQFIINILKSAKKLKSLPLSL